jgi:hypothetical protein
VASVQQERKTYHDQTAYPLQQPTHACAVHIDVHTTYWLSLLQQRHFCLRQKRSVASDADAPKIQLLNAWCVDVAQQAEHGRVPDKQAWPADDTVIETRIAKA